LLQVLEMSADARKELRNLVTRKAVDEKNEPKVEVKKKEQEMTDAQEVKVNVTVTSVKETAPRAWVKVGPHTIEAVIDGGATCNVMSEKFRKMCQLPIDRRPNISIKGISGQAVPIRGQVLNVPVTIGEETLPLDFDILEECADDLLIGKKWLKQHFGTTDWYTGEFKIWYQGKPISIKTHDKGPANVTTAEYESGSESDQGSEEEGMFDHCKLIEEVERGEVEKIEEPPTNNGKEEDVVVAVNTHVFEQVDDPLALLLDAQEQQQEKAEKENLETTKAEEKVESDDGDSDVKMSDDDDDKSKKKKESEDSDDNNDEDVTAVLRKADIERKCQPEDTRKKV